MMRPKLTVDCSYDGILGMGAVAEVRIGTLSPLPPSNLEAGAKASRPTWFSSPAAPSCAQPYTPQLYGGVSMDDVWRLVYLEAMCAQVRDHNRKILQQRFKSKQKKQKQQPEPKGNVVVKLLHLLSPSNKHTTLYPRDASLLREVLMTECRYHSLLNHPNIVRFHGVVLDDCGLPCGSILEYLTGGTLRDLIYPGSSESTKTPLDPLPGKRVWQITRDIAQALAYIHSIGLVHLDIKPRNILFAADGTAKLADFGDAHPAHSRRQPLRFGVGTLVYAPPELVASPDRFFSLVLTPEMDLFSFGVLLTEIALRRTPTPDLLFQWNGFSYVPVAWEENLRKEDVADIPYPALRTLTLHLLRATPALRWSPKAILTFLKTCGGAFVLD